MLKYLLFILTPLCSSTLFAQDAKAILLTSRLKCTSVQNGIYHHTHSLRSFQTSDTIRDAYDCIFKRSSGDTLFDWNFHNKWYYQGKYMGDMLYTGSVWAIFNDSIGQTISIQRHGDYIKRAYTGNVIYAPFQEQRTNPFPSPAVYTDTTNNFQDLGIEKTGVYTCHHIQLTEPEGFKYSDSEKRIKKITDFWINVSDSILVQYVSFEQVLYANDTAWFFTKDVLDSYHLNTLKDETALSASSIPPHCKLKEYTPEKPKIPLPAGSIAPDWSAISIDGRKFSLASLKGRLVLLDFFYESCFPCIEALPALRRLHEKYKGKGLQVIGFDPFDKRGEGLTKFQKERKINYPIIADCTAINNDYHVSFYPTIYLIGKDGKIIYSGSGFSDEDDKKIEELIIKHIP